jgi:hypothetical protein
MSSERMLFEAGRESARAEARVRFWIAASTGMFLIIVLGFYSFVERSQRQTLELTISRLEQSKSRELLPPVIDSPTLVAITDHSPYSYWSLRLLAPSIAMREEAPAQGALPTHAAVTDSKSNTVPLRVRDTQQLLDF